MSKGRLEAFSDGVIAILITILVLELKIPHGASFEDLRGLLPIFLSYVLSFLFIGIYWNNHHHMLHLAERIDGKILWANQHLLFWLSLVPFATGWMGENHFAPLPTAVYGVVLGGWASNSRWALLGGIRGSAQMISYEIAMGLALTGAVMTFGTLDLQAIARAQGHHFFGVIPAWGIIYQPLGFLIFTAENTYGLDVRRMKADGTDDALRLTCSTLSPWRHESEWAP